jgi:serine/threonine protein phosphatase PrpC
MGLGLTHPVSSKQLYRLGNKQFRVGAATMHGWRETMEDAHAIHLSLNNHPTSAFFGIFDGHSGSACSKYIAEKLPANLNSLSNFSDKDVSLVVMETDQQFLDNENFKNKDDGSAGIFTIASYDETTKKYTLLNANIGDSRTVLAQKQTDQTYVAIPCTFDHKPTNDEERKRIEEAGGSVQIGRVDGQLALSRAFGDRMLKTLHLAPEKRKVTSKPEIIVKEATVDDFLFLACDGIYEGDVFSREGVIKFVQEKMEETDDIAWICALVLDECLKRGSRDNMSAMIVQFVDGTAYAKDPEYLPGPYYSDDGDSKFQEAYMKDAQEAGFSLEQALKLRQENEEKEKAKLQEQQKEQKEQQSNSNK